MMMAHPLQSPKLRINLTSARVAQGFGAVIAVIGTSAFSPKSCGKSPGERKGQVRNKRKPYLIVKNRVDKG